MFVSSEYRGLSNKYALNTWVKSATFPKDEYFRHVDLLRTIIKEHREEGEGEPAYEVIAATLASCIAGGGVLASYILTKNDQTVEVDEWPSIYLAAAWKIIASYDAAVQSDEWDPA